MVQFDGELIPIRAATAFKNEGWRTWRDVVTQCLAYSDSPPEDMEMSLLRTPGIGNKTWHLVVPLLREKLANNRKWRGDLNPKPKPRYLDWTGTPPRLRHLDPKDAK